MHTFKKLPIISPNMNMYGSISACCKCGMGNILFLGGQGSGVRGQGTGGQETGGQVVRWSGGQDFAAKKLVRYSSKRCKYYGMSIIVIIGMVVNILLL